MSYQSRLEMFDNLFDEKNSFDDKGKKSPQPSYPMLSFERGFPFVRLKMKSDAFRRATEFVGVYRGWDYFNVQKAMRMNSPRIEVVDSDLSNIPGRYRRRFSDEREIEDAIDELIGCYESEDYRAEMDSGQNRAILDQLRASKYFLREVVYKLDFTELVKNTQGVDLRHFDEEGVIGLQKERVVLFLNRLGYRDSNFGEAFNEFRNRNVLSPDQLKYGMSKVVSTTMPMLKDYLGLKNLDPRFDNPAELITFINNPGSSYRMDAHHRDGRPELVVNIGKDYLKGDEVAYAYHEFLTHIVHLDALKNNVLRGVVVPELGIQTLHGPQGYMKEGLAQTLLLFLPGDKFRVSLVGRFAMEWRILQRYVFNNAQLIVNEPGDKSIKYGEAFKYVKSKLPFMSDKEIEIWLTAREEKGLDRPYYYIYGVAGGDFSDISVRLRRAENRVKEFGIRREFLKRLTGYPRTPAQVNELAVKLEEAV